VGDCWTSDGISIAGHWNSNPNSDGISIAGHWNSNPNSDGISIAGPLYRTAIRTAASDLPTRFAPLRSLTPRAGSRHEGAPASRQQRPRCGRGGRCGAAIIAGPRGGVGTWRLAERLARRTAVLRGQVSSCCRPRWRCYPHPNHPDETPLTDSPRSPPPSRTRTSRSRPAPSTPPTPSERPPSVGPTVRARPCRRRRTAPY
jgi:hypothetical protein